MRRVVSPVVVAVVLVTFLFVAVMPTRTYLQQRSQLTAAEDRVEVLAEQNEALEERITQLQTDEEIERLAREQYNLVKPGEEAYAILPPADEVPTTTTPAGRDDNESADSDTAESDRSWWERAVDAVLPG